jgi:hypothetical protein
MINTGHLNQPATQVASVPPAATTVVPAPVANPVNIVANEEPATDEPASVAGLRGGPRKSVRAKNARKPKRTPEEIARAEDAAASALAERVKKASDKAAATREKAAAKRARDMLKEAEAAAKEASNKQRWNDNSSLALLELIKRIKEEYLELKSKTGGFMKFTQFFGTREHYKKHFPLLVDVTSKAMWSRYQAIMVAYRVCDYFAGGVSFLVRLMYADILVLLQKVKDQVDQSGSGGIHDALDRFHLPLSVSDDMATSVRPR